ncbi:hypothetical protein G9U51_10065 [Calidifontibacter sp. DB0510]|uniref:Methylamine utilisation protein MauE domain-containing protein n=1 Tax=Metallococcus carri TaxID=1656884 RepID=A0A967AZR7_9MICO|nr:MauE/DoxX family redox-associated membrane protein [Metallococcus carri]NHN56121.1 hypothetical protein [Metallococcus carri]NOP37422.1 hypothetical protein [Calidifontibacter sp. DB2511S]
MNSPALVVPAVLLALVLVASGLLKARDTRTAEDAFVSLRLPAVLRRLRAPLLLPYAELVLAALLLLTPAPLYAAVAVATLLLFLAYAVVVARALRFPEPVECSCFGRLGTGEITGRTLVRNGLLVLLAAIAVIDALAGHSVVGRLRDFDGTAWGWLAGVLVAVVVTAVVTVGSGRDGGRHTAGRADGRHTAGDAFTEGDELDYQRQPIPYGSLRSTDGAMFTLSELAAEQPTLLVLLSIGCGPCVRTMNLLPAWAPQHPILRVVAVPSSEAAPEQLPDLGASITWMFDPERMLARTFPLGYPSAVLLGRDGLLAGGPVGGYEQIAAFLDDIATELAEVEQLTEASG